MNEAKDSKFVTRKWNIVNDQPYGKYGLGNEILYNIEVLKSNLCDYSDAYNLVRSDIDVTAALTTALALFIKCITEIDETAKDDAEDLHLVMPTYNLIEYNLNYSETTGSF